MGHLKMQVIHIPNFKSLVLSPKVNFISNFNSSDHTDRSAPMCPVLPNADLHTKFEVIPFLKYSVNKNLRNHSQKLDFRKHETQILPEMMKTNM